MRGRQGAVSAGFEQMRGLLGVSAVTSSVVNEPHANSKPMARVLKPNADDTKGVIRVSMDANGDVATSWTKHNTTNPVGERRGSRGCCWCDCCCRPAIELVNAKRHMGVGLGLAAWRSPAPLPVSGLCGKGRRSGVLGGVKSRVSLAVAPSREACKLSVRLSVRLMLLSLWLSAPPPCCAPLESAAKALRKGSFMPSPASLFLGHESATSSSVKPPKAHPSQPGALKRSHGMDGESESNPPLAGPAIKPNVDAAESNAVLRARCSFVPPCCTIAVRQHVELQLAMPMRPRAAITEAMDVLRAYQALAPTRTAIRINNVGLQPNDCVRAPTGGAAKIFVAENTATAAPSHREAPPPSPPPPPPPPPLPPPSCLRSGARVGNTRAYDIVEATVVTSSAGSVAAISMGASTELIALRRKTWCLCRCLAAKGKSRFSVVDDASQLTPTLG